uniref:Ig-like domain-containing protein n=1 Tax=Periophthalmus magnuspinnatus TaxID=409849 RepID=A0A3B4AZ21_9GOBI
MLKELILHNFGEVFEPCYLSSQMRMLWDRKRATSLVPVCAGAVVAAVDVLVHLGQNVTLSCSYDVSSGPLSSCWSRGRLPSFGMCGSNAIVSSDGNTTKSPVSRRYVLGGHLAQGDVSLTILNVTREDAGTYGCRVDIPGWNNDLKHHFNLEIRQGKYNQNHGTFRPDLVQHNLTFSRRRGRPLSSCCLCSSPCSSSPQQPSSSSVSLNQD